LSIPGPRVRGPRPSLASASTGSWQGAPPASADAHQRRQALLTQMRQLVHDRTIYAPILADRRHVRRRAAGRQSTFGLIAGYPCTPSFEDITLRETLPVVRRRRKICLRKIVKPSLTH
jgi:hypothetical protein